MHVQLDTLALMQSAATVHRHTSTRSRCSQAMRLILELTCSAVVGLQLRWHQLIRLIWFELRKQQAPGNANHSKEIEDTGPTQMLDEGATQDKTHCTANIKAPKDG